MTQVFPNYFVAEGKALVLRCCRPSMVSSNNFRWPVEGPVSCPDWHPKPECGNGLHGWLWGEGVASSASLDLDDLEIRWLVVEVSRDALVDLDGKVKFPSGWVLYCGDRQTAIDLLVRFRGADRPIIGHTVTGGRCATAGDYGKAVAGDYGFASAGSYGVAEAGDFGHSVVRSYGTAVTGIGGRARAGVLGRLVAGTGSATVTLLVGEMGTKPDVWYELVGGTLVEAEDQSPLDSGGWSK